MLSQYQLDAFQNHFLSGNNQKLKAAFQSLRANLKSLKRDGLANKLYFELEGQTLRSLRNDKIINYSNTLIARLQEHGNNEALVSDLKSMQGLSRDVALQQIADSNKKGASRKAIEAARELIKQNPSLLDRRARYVLVQELQRQLSKGEKLSAVSEANLRKVISGIQNTDRNLPHYFESFPSKIEALRSGVIKATQDYHPQVSQKQQRALTPPATKPRASTTALTPPATKPRAGTARPSSKDKTQQSVRPTPKVRAEVLKQSTGAEKITELKQLVGPLNESLKVQRDQIGQIYSKCGDIASQSQSFSAIYKQEGGFSGLLWNKVKSVFGRGRPFQVEEMTNLANEVSENNGKLNVAFWDFKKALAAGNVNKSEEALSRFSASYANVLGSEILLAEKLAEIKSKSGPGSVVGTIANDTLNVLSIVGIGAVIKGGVAASSLGIKGASALVAKQITKQGLKRSALCSLAFSVPLTSIEYTKSKELNKSLELFRQDPKKSVEAMRGLIQNIERQSLGSGVAPSPVLKENLLKAKENLNNMDRQLTRNADLNFAQVSSTFAQIFVTCTLFDIGFKTVHAASPKPVGGERVNVGRPQVAKSSGANNVVTKVKTAVTDMIGGVRETIEKRSSENQQNKKARHQAEAQRKQQAREKKAKDAELKQQGLDYVREAEARKRKAARDQRAGSRQTQGGPKGEIRNSGVVAGNLQGVTVEHGRHCVSSVVSKPGRTGPCEDHAVVTQRSDGTTVIGVMDGMGGHANGDEASRIAARSIEAAVREGKDVNDVLYRAHHEILQRGDRSGTTACVAEIAPNGEAIISNIGDSCAFVVRRNGTVQKIVHEDAFFIELVPKAYRDRSWYDNLANLTQKARTDPDAARALEIYREKRHMITKALGTENPSIDGSGVKLESGDMLLVVSDGISDVLSTTAIGGIVAKGGGAKSIAQRIMKTAAERPNGVDGRVRWGSQEEVFMGKSDDKAVVVFVQE